MFEKDALSGVLVSVCDGLDIGITAHKGYSSSSTMYEIGQRLKQKAGEGKQIKVYIWATVTHLVLIWAKR